MNKQILVLMTTFSVISAQAQIKYPATPKDQTVDDYFGVKVADSYRWLENDTSAATAQWVEAENKVTNAYLQKIPFRGKLLKRLKEVSNYEKIGTPFKRHGRWYVYKNNGLQNQSVLYVMDKLGGEERVFLDPNRLSADGTVALKGVWFSHNGKYAAYAISRSGSDWQEFYVMDAQTGQLLPDHIEWAKFSGAPGRATVSTIQPMTLPWKARNSQIRTKATRSITIGWAPRRATMCSSIRIRRIPCASMALT